MAEASGPVQALVSEVVSNEGQLAPTLRAVFENENGDIRPSEFMEALDAYKKRMDGDIEHMCNKYYQGFIESVDELLHVRNHAMDLKTAVVDTRDGLEETSHDVEKALENLLEARTVQKNVLTAIQSLSECQPVIRLYCKAQSQLQNKKYYAALKSLQELDANMLHHVKQYTFVKLMRQRIPLMRNQVKEVAFAEMKHFLALIRDHCSTIGESAMAKTKNSQSALGSVLLEANASEQADFSPIYRCLHIYDVLGVREQCEKYYKEERRKQTDLVLIPTSQMTSSEGYRAYLHQVAGFFIVEDTVLATTQKFLSSQWLEDLWEAALTTVSKVIQSQLSRCSTAGTIEEVKELIVLFNQTLQGYGFNVSRLYNILIQVTDRYIVVLQHDQAKLFEEVLGHDNYTPLQVDDEEGYAAVVAQFGYEDRVLKEAPFPKSFPFSAAVPQIYCMVRAFIDKTVRFVENLDMSQTEVDEIVRKATNTLLSKVLSGAMSRVVMKSHLGLPQLTQVSVNTTHLEMSCDRLEEYISGHTHNVADALHETRLHGADTFKDARTAAEEKIFLVLQNQIDQFLGLAEYNWCPAKPRNEPSEHIYDLLAYLSTIFASLTNLPTDVARSAYFSTCKYISNQLLDVVVSPDITRVNMNGIQSFAVDVETCEAYADNCPLVARGDGLFRDVFIRLRELVNLFINWDWSAYLNLSQRGKAYSQLRPDVALLWLEKFDDSSKSKFGIKRGDDRKKSKEVEAIIKQLRQQTTPGRE